MISTDQLLFLEGSEVRRRQIEYSAQWDEIHILVFSLKRKEAEEMIAPHVWVYSTQSLSKWFYILNAFRLGKKICREKGITTITCQDAFFTAVVGMWLKRSCRVPVELQVHTDIGSPYFTYTIGNRIRKLLAVIFLPRADRVRVVSERIETFIVNTLGVDSGKIEVRPIVVDVERVQNTPITVNLHQKYPQFSKIVLMASRFEKEKNIMLALQSWPLVIQQIPHAGLVIVGSGSQERNLKDFVYKINLGHVVVIESWQKDIISYYKTADLFLSTSFYEGYGMTLVEAHAAGCPVVSTDVGVAKEIGATIVPFDEKIISSVIISALR